MRLDRVLERRPTTDEDLKRLDVYDALAQMGQYERHPDQPYTGARLSLKTDPDVGCPQFFYEIKGPFISTVHVGTTERCGPETVRMLNLAYKAGRRAAENRQRELSGAEHSLTGGETK
jgi:hypothetical protein